MKHQDVDPSLCATEPLLDSLDDGFSPPADAQAQPPQDSPTAESPEATLGRQSPF
jgi:hypothetical protein